MSDAVPDRLDRALPPVSARAGLAVAIDCPMLDLTWRSGSDMPFRIASLTKPFVAAAIHRLSAERRLSLEATLPQVVDPGLLGQLADGGYDVARITIGHLLSHTSGIFDHSTDAAYIKAVFEQPQRRWSRADQVAHAIRYGSPYGQPGAVYGYSDTGYVILGDIVERMTNQPLGPAVRRLLDFEAIGLRRTWWEAMETIATPPPALAAQDADGIDTSRFDPSFDLFGGGGLIADVADLRRFMRAMVDGKLLPPRHLIAALLVPPSLPHQMVPAPWRTHGFLFSTMRMGRHWVLGQTGHWGSVMLYCADLDASLALTVNRSGADAGMALRTLSAALLDVIAAATGRKR